MDENKTGRQMIAIIKAVMKNTVADFKQNDINWDELFHLSKNHSIANVVAYGINNIAPAEVLERFEQLCYMNILCDTKMQYDMTQVEQKFGEKQVCYMPLKGIIMKQYYPSSDMRTMSDIDFLIKKEDSQKAKEIMKRLGYSIRFENVEEDTYRKKSISHIELHKQLVGTEYGKFHRYYLDGWKFAKRTTLNPYRYAMTDEDYFVFHMVHLTKHYITGGIGVRALIDIWMYLRCKKDKLDWGYIDSELEKLQILKFSKLLLKLVDMWFENGSETAVLKEIENYIFNSGTYGKYSTYIITKQMNGTGVSTKLKQKVRMLFPDIKVMSGLYPNLNKTRVLLPVYWCRRVGRKIIKGRENVPHAQYVPTKNEKVTLCKHFNEVGLGNI